MLGVLNAVEHFETYLQQRQFTLITDCSALLWLFTSQNLSSKMHRWALKLMAYDMVLKWRRGTENVGLDALSRLQRRSSQELDGEALVSGDFGKEMPQKKPAGPVLDGVPLQQLAPPLEPLQQVDKEQPQLGALNDLPVELQPLVKQRREELTLDGIRLADLGATEVDVSEEVDIAVFYALQLTPERLGAVDVDWMSAQEGELFIGLAALQLEDTMAVALG